MALWIPNASPLFFYSPAPAYFADSAYTASWTGAVDTSAAAPNNTYHQTGGPAAVILPSIYATALTPVYDQPGAINVALTVDTGTATDWASGTTWAGSFGAHTFEFDVKCNGADCSSDPLKFQGAWLETEFVPSGDPVNVTLDDASAIVSYTGFSAVSSSASGVAAGSTDYDATLSMTGTAGATAQVTFEGSAIVVTGVASPSCGSFSVELDGTTSTLSAYNNVTAHAVPLFFATSLSTSGTHTLTLTALSGGEAVGLVVDAFTAYGTAGQVGFIGTEGGATTTITDSAGGAATGSAATSTATSTSGAAVGTSGGASSIGTVIGAVVGVLAGLAILFYVMRRLGVPLKKNDKAKKLDPWDEANLLQNMKDERVFVTTAAKDQRYVYPGLIAHSELK